MLSDQKSDLSGHVRQAAVREVEAWRRLRTEPPALEERHSLFEQWIDAHRELREAQEQVTISAVALAMDSLRTCAEILHQPVPAFAPSAIPASAPAPERFVQPPLMGQVWLGRGETLWDVVSVTHDAMEEGYFLVQIQQRGRGGEPYDVYTDDWVLFCVVHGLRAPA